MKNWTLKAQVLIFAAVIFSSVMTASAQTTVFTYQGRLNDATLPQPTNGSYEMQYKLFDSVTVGTGQQLGTTQTVPNVSVVNGIFTVQLDFGGTLFRGTDIYIEISLRPTGSSATLTTLTPRQQITSAPLAIRSRIANLSENSNNSDSLGGFPASNYVQTTDTRLFDDRNPLPSSSNYIQNQNSFSQAANFSIGGSGSVGGNFNVGGNITGNGANITNLNAGNITTGTLLAARGGTGLNASGATGNFLRSNGSIWTSAPLQSTDIPTGSGNYIQNSSVVQASSNFNVSGIGTVGGLFSANIVNSTTNFRIGGAIVFSTPNATSIVAGQLSNHALLSSNNAFFGYKAGQAANNFSQANTFLGSEAGETTTSGGNNSFVGSNAGFFNSSGSLNSFFGSGAGQSNTTADANSFFGYEAGFGNTTGTRNSFFGFQAGRGSLTVNNNSFFGYQAGTTTTGANNAFFGSLAGVVNNSGSENTFFGSSSGLVNTTGINNTFIGSKSGNSNTSGSDNTFVGFQSDANGNKNIVIGANANTSGSNNTNIGYTAFANGSNNTNIGYSTFADGSNNTVIGYQAKVSGAATVNNSTALGAGAVVKTSNTIVLGTSLEEVDVPGNLRVSGFVNADTVGANDINGDTITGSIIQATAQLKTVFASGGSTSVCRTSQNIFAVCSSSLRYKTNIAPYQSGLNLVRQLRPIIFTWKDGGMRDLGFGAEDVAKIDPLLVIYNDSGQVEGVKYDRISAILVNSVKEQQMQIEAQGEQIKAQQAQIEALKQIVCSMNPAAQICGK